MLKLRTDLIGLSPFIGIMGYLWGRTTWAAARYGGYPLATATGFAAIIFAAIAFVLLVVRTNMITRWFLCFFGLALCGIGILFAVVGEFQGMYVLIFSCWYEGVYGFAVGHDIIRHLPRQRTSVGETIRSLFPSPSRREIAGFVLCVAIGVSGLVMTQSWQLDSRVELRFHVSAQDLQRTELGLYLADSYDYDDPQAFVDILRDTNTTLLLQGNPDLFREIVSGSYNGTHWGRVAANLTRLCNTAGVKVEIWPVGMGGLSLRNVDNMSIVYQYFQGWLARNSITVDYYAFDIEDSVPRPLIKGFDASLVGRATPHSSPLYGTLSGIYDMAERQAFMRTNRSNWGQLVAQQQALVDQIIADGIIPRGTLNPNTMDALDGDYTASQIDFMQSYEIRGYDYLSQMIYRSCEWGNNDSTYKVYSNGRVLDAVSPYPRSAICLGCIAYPAYETKEEVANDVWLSVAAGVDSARLFRVESWLNREANETAGFAAVRDMLELCRAGGTAVTDYRAAWENGIFGAILADVLGDL